jgi:hypothetical protein
MQADGKKDGRTDGQTDRQKYLPTQSTMMALESQTPMLRSP